MQLQYGERMAYRIGKRGPAANPVKHLSGKRITTIATFHIRMMPPGQTGSLNGKFLGILFNNRLPLSGFPMEAAYAQDNQQQCNKNISVFICVHNFLYFGTKVHQIIELSTGG
ncbi:MAG: hypothetical protein LBU22_08145 [Dysgonamonadaceae bacterium]|jgi:hypothetical protein|nr:hypothetical protein [Dysgonamonadaceae bacterium]